MPQTSHLGKTPAGETTGATPAAGALRYASESGKQIVDRDLRFGASEWRDAVAGGMPGEAVVAVFSRIATLRGACLEGIWCRMVGGRSSERGE